MLNELFYSAIGLRIVLSSLVAWDSFTYLKGYKKKKSRASIWKTKLIALLFGLSVIGIFVDMLTVPGLSQVASFLTAWAHTLWRLVAYLGLRYLKRKDDWLSRRFLI